MINTKEKRKGIMKDKKTKQTAAKVASNILTATLKLEANNASCSWIYEPKQPEAIKRFQKVK